MKQKLTTTQLFTVAMAVLAPAALLVRFTSKEPTFDLFFFDETYAVRHSSLELMSAALLAVFAIAYYAVPKLLGTSVSERLGRWHFWLTFVPLCAIIAALWVMARLARDSGLLGSQGRLLLGVVLVSS